MLRRNNPTMLTFLCKGEHNGIVLRHVTFLSSEFQRRVATRAGFGLSRPQKARL